jgi:hypothetical protein
VSPGKEVRRVSRSLYLAGPGDAIAVLAGELGIRPERCLARSGLNGRRRAHGFHRRGASGSA